MTNSLYIPILIFSVLIFILFLYIMILSIIQYKQYTLTTGTAKCTDKNVASSCILSFEYQVPNGTIKKYEKLMSFEELNQEGTFSVDVAYKLNGDSIDKVYIIGSNFHIFLGTQNNVIIYSILSFLALILVCSLIPWKSIKLPKKHH